MRIGRIKFKLFFAWYDAWVGAYWERRRGVLYICPLPMVVFRFERVPYDATAAACLRALELGDQKQRDSGERA